MAALSDWKSFWDSDHSIYVNAHHKDVHYRTIAEQIAAFVPGPQARVLDYGCGEALHAEVVAAVAAQVLLSDSADSVRAAMARRLASNPRIKVLSPDEVAALPDGSLDLIVSNSVVQYLTLRELERLLALWRRLLAPGGSLIVSSSAGRRKAERRRRASALRRAARIPAGGACRTRAHRRLALPQATQHARHRAVHRG